MTIPILFEDKFLLVIDKPAGVVVNRSETSGGETIQEWAESKMTNIVHRLDKETSGCLIIAKSPEAFIELQRQFKAREVEKEYVALVHGRVEPKEGIIRVPLARSRYDRKKFAVVPGGRISETGFRIESRFTFHGLPFTLLRLFPKTGRTHQIRVHLKYFGHPIVSDDTYAGKDRAREDRIWCPRMFLHAARLRFTHPETKKKVDISAPIPGNLQRVLTEFF